MTSEILRGKPESGKPHVWFEGEKGATGKSRRGFLLCKRVETVAVAAALGAVSAFGAATVDTVGFAEGGGRNTVSGADQIVSTGRVRFEGEGRTGGLLCIGSSYAWHGPMEKELGWSGDWGMAASARSNDCAHVVWEAVRKVRPTAPLCIAQSAVWERNYTGDVALLEREYAAVRDFKADWIFVLATAANAPKALADAEPLDRHYATMVDWFVKLNPGAKVAVAVGSSGPKFSQAIRAYAAAKGYPVVDYNDFLNEPGMRATGLFAHKGVAYHPSDAGFREMGRRFSAALGLGPKVVWDDALMLGHTPGEKMFYAPGEEMVFTIDLVGVKGVEGDLPDGEYFIDWTRWANDGKTEKGRVPASIRKPLVVRTRLDIPGFVKIEANVVDRNGKRIPKKHMWEKRVFFQGGAGVDVDKIEPFPEPKDFDAYWAELKRMDRELPLQVLERVEVPCENANARLWRVKLNVPGGVPPAIGFLAMPKDASATKRYPAEGCLSGYYRFAESCPKWFTNSVPRVKFYLNRHGAEVDREAAYYEPFWKTDGTPEQLRGMAIRMLRLYRYLKTLPEWDGQTLTAGGSSGGAMQSVWAAAMVDGLTSANAHSPAGCDMLGARVGHAKPGVFRAVDACAYFDIIHLAKRAKCPVTLVAGLGDYVCPPTGLAVVYRNIPTKKQITWHQGCTHGWWPRGMAKQTLSSGGRAASVDVSAGVEALTTGAKGVDDPLARLGRDAAALDPVAYVKAALAKGAKTVKVPKGTYEILPEGDETSYFRLCGLRDVTVDFSGSKLIGKVRTRMFDFVGCTNLTVRNVTVDYAELPFTQATIEKVDAEGNWDVRIVDGYPRPEGRQLDEGLCWPIQAYGRETLELVNPMRFRDGIAIARTGADTYRITGGGNRTGQVGDIAVWSVKDVTHRVEVSALKCLRCTACRFEDITEYATPHGCAFEDYFGDANTYLRCRIVRCPPEEDLVPRAMKRLRSGNHDANMHRGAIRGPRILDCESKYHCDDCVNISGMYGLVTESKGDELRILVNYLGLSIDDGDTCQVMTYDGVSLPDVKVLKVVADGETTAAEKDYMLTLGFWPGLEKSCRRAYRLKLEKPLDLPRGSVIISNRHQGNGFVIRGCDFGHNRARGLLIKASGGTIESNRLERCHGAGIQIATEYQWMEGGCSRDLIVRGNVLKDNGSGIDIGGNNGARKRLPVDSHRDLTVTDNRIEGVRGGVTVVGCRGLTLGGNDIRLADSKAQKVTLVNVESVSASVPGANGRRAASGSCATDWLRCQR